MAETGQELPVGAAIVKVRSAYLRVPKSTANVQAQDREADLPARCPS